MNIFSWDNYDLKFREKEGSVLIPNEVFSIELIRKICLTSQIKSKVLFINYILKERK